MTIHTQPTVNGMGAFANLQDGKHWKQKFETNAKLVLSNLDDESFERIVVAEARRRPALVASRVIGEVTK